MVAAFTGINETYICNYLIYSQNGKLFMHPNRLFSDMFALVDHHKRKYARKNKDTDINKAGIAQLCSSSTYESLKSCKRRSRSVRHKIKKRDRSSLK